MRLLYILILLWILLICMVSSCSVSINPSKMKIGDVEGMKIVSISVDGNNINSLDYKSSLYDLKNEFINVKSGVEQNIYLTNNKETKDFSLSIKIEISSDIITWNGIRYDLTKYSSVSPLILGSWIDETGNLIVPNIFFDVYNKGINYQDLAKNGGYAIAYQNNGKNYIELKIDGLSVNLSATTLIDPIYYNETDGFKIDVGSNNPYGIVTNNSDFWITDVTDDFVYHTNRTGGNITNGFSTGLIGSDNPMGLTSNGSDFWIVDSGDYFVYHTNKSGYNYTDGFSILGLGSDNTKGITTNGSDFWIVDYTDKFVYHTNKSGYNYTDGFSTSIIGSANPYGIVTNNSDFWITDVTDDFVYHTDRLGNNITDSFSTGLIGSGYPYGITTNLTTGFPTDFWIVDNIDLFVYHLSYKDLTPPTITNPRNFTQQVNLSFSQDMSATDDSGISYYLFNDTSTFNISQSGIIKNVSSLNQTKIYWLNYSVNDSVGNQVSLVFYIELTPEPILPPEYCNNGLRAGLQLIILFSVLAIVFIPLYYIGKEKGVNVVLLGAIAIIVSLAIFSAIGSNIASIGCG